MRLFYDRDADAAYIYLEEKPYAYGVDIRDDRRVDYAADDTPIGIELLMVSKGVDLDRLPWWQEILGLLQSEGIRGYPPPCIELAQSLANPQAETSSLDVSGQDGAERSPEVRRVEGSECTSTSHSFATTLR
ncbi:MAG: DUF2283 domain-containing protein [Chloroflexota bacterium]